MQNETFCPGFLLEYPTVLLCQHKLCHFKYHFGGEFFVLVVCAFDQGLSEGIYLELISAFLSSHVTI